MPEILPINHGIEWERPNLEDNGMIYPERDQAVASLYVIVEIVPVRL